MSPTGHVPPLPPPLWADTSGAPLGSSELGIYTTPVYKPESRPACQTVDAKHCVANCRHTPSSSLTSRPTQSWGRRAQISLVSKLRLREESDFPDSPARELAEMHTQSCAHSAVCTVRVLKTTENHKPVLFLCSFLPLHLVRLTVSQDSGERIGRTQHHPIFAT